MPERPDPIARLDRLTEAANIAHQTIFNYQLELAHRGEADDRSRALVRESTKIVFERLANVLAAARELAARWIDESVLDPTAAAGTLAKLEAELQRIAPDVAQLLARQREIARELRQRLPD